MSDQGRAIQPDCRRRCRLPADMVMTRPLRMAAVAVTIGLALLIGHAQEPGREPPLRLAIAGLVHGHVTGFLRAAQARQDVQIVGVFEPDAALRAKYAERYSLADDVLFDNLATMLDRAHPEAVASFTNTADHADVVEAA